MKIAFKLEGINNLLTDGNRAITGELFKCYYLLFYDFSTSFSIFKIDIQRITQQVFINNRIQLKNLTDGPYRIIVGY